MTQLLSNRSILVVEDEYFLADDIARAFQRAGAEVVGPVPDRDEALSLLSARQAIDGAVLDINLQGEMIFPVADALQARGIPFVFATGYDSSSIPGRYEHVPRWEKPFDVQSLVRALPSLVAGP